MNIVDETPTSWLIMTPDGSTETKTKSSDLNKLLYGHDLFALLEFGDEIWVKDPPEEKSVTIIPGEDAMCYTLRVEGLPDLSLGEHHKTKLIEAMAKIYDEYDGESVTPLLDLYDSIRSDMAREKVLSIFLDALSEKVEERDNGWFINGHLLLTYEGEMYHPSTHSRKRSGGRVVSEGSSTQAYSIRDYANVTEDMRREVTLNGEKYRLTDREMKFVGKAMWAIKNTPDRR